MMGSKVLALCGILSVLAAAPLRAEERPVSDPNVELAQQPLQFEKIYTYQKTAVLRFPFEGDSVYAEAAEESLLNALQTDGRWNVLDPQSVHSTLQRDMISPESPAYTEDQLKTWASEWKVDTLWIVRAPKRGQSVLLSLELWNAHNRQPWLKWEEPVEAGVDTKSTANATQTTARTILGRIPFDAEVLSRDGGKITLGIGSKARLKVGQSLFVMRVKAVRKHPSFRTVEELYLDQLGRVKITQVEEDLAFAEIEKEDPTNPILAQHKIVVPVEPAQDPEVLARSQSAAAGADKVAFGESAETWVPRGKPSLGFAALSLGVGGLEVNDSPLAGTNNSQSASFIPSARLDAELWISRLFFMTGYIQQTLISLSEKSGTNPLSLHSSATAVGFAPGVRYLLHPNDIQGPQIRLMMGYSRFSFFVDSSVSDPSTELTSKTYHGFTVLADMKFPIEKWFVGLGFSRTFFTMMTEEPLTSGDSNSSVAWTFFLSGGYAFSDRWQLAGRLHFENYSSTFSGQGTRTTPSASSSLQFVNFETGVSYFF
jgi:hypothetical protein